MRDDSDGSKACSPLTPDWTVTCPADRDIAVIRMADSAERNDMKRFGLILVLGVFAGCTPAPVNPTRTGPDGVEIQFTDGRNCWNNRCMRYDQKNRWVSVTGRHPVLIASNIDLRDGYVTEAEFNAMFERANRALSRGAGASGR